MRVDHGESGIVLEASFVDAGLVQSIEVLLEVGEDLWAWSFEPLRLHDVHQGVDVCRIGVGDLGRLDVQVLE